MTITPRTRFQEDKKRAAAHRDLVVSSNFLSAAEAALLQVVNDLPETTIPEAAIAGYHRVIGARTFLRELSNLAEVAKTPSRNPDFNLNHNIK